MVGMAPVAAVPHMYSPLRYLTPVAREVRIIDIITMLIIAIVLTITLPTSGLWGWYNFNRFTNFSCLAPRENYYSSRNNHLCDRHSLQSFNLFEKCQ